MLVASCENCPNRRRYRGLCGGRLAPVLVRIPRQRQGLGGFRSREVAGLPGGLKGGEKGGGGERVERGWRERVERGGSGEVGSREGVLRG